MIEPVDQSGQGVPDRYPATRPHELRIEQLTKLAVVYARQSSPQQVRDNIGSTAVQRALAELPLRWGWPPELTKVIDDDLGLSGKSTHRRLGFRQMIELIDAGKVGAVFVYDVSRISRDPLDAEIFLQKIIRHRVPIVAQGRLYSPSAKDIAALLGLRVQNLFAWVDNETRAQRFLEAKHATIRKGRAVSPPPIGYRECARGKWVMDDNLLVQEAIRRVFLLYPERGSVAKVAKHHHRQGLLFPRRVNGQMRWEPITPMQIAKVLANPNYTDAYVYNRQHVIEADDSHPRKVIQLSQSEWLIERGHHDPYVTWENWQEIQRLLADRRVKRQPPVATGLALVQGLVWCGPCGRWIRTTYDMKDRRRRRPTYVCRPADRYGKVKRCFSAAAYPVDRAVEQCFLQGVTPATLEAVLDAVKSARDERHRIGWTHQRVVQEATDAVREADRRHREADAAKPWAKTYLEQQLNDAVQRLAEIKAQQKESFETETLSLDDDESAELLRLAADLPTIWSAPTTTDEDRKALLRAVFARIVILRKTEQAVEFEIEWHSGHRQEGRTFRSKSIEEHVAAAHHAGHSGARAITRALQAQGVMNAFGNQITETVVSNALGRLGIQRHHEWTRALSTIRQWVLEGKTRPEMLAELRARGVRHWLGVWTRSRLDSAIQRLRLGTIPEGVEPLPSGHEVARAFKSPPRMVELIRAGCSPERPWRVVVDEINALGFRCAKGGMLTVAAARTLHHFWTRKIQEGERG